MGDGGSALGSHGGELERINDDIQTNNDPDARGGAPGVSLRWHHAGEIFDHRCDPADRGDGGAGIAADIVRIIGGIAGRV
jgi:hypothetical protein